MTFWQWANRKSQSVVEFALKLVLAIGIIIAFGIALFSSGPVLQSLLSRVNLNPPLTAEVCADDWASDFIKENFVSRYNQQAVFTHLAVEDISTRFPRAVTLNSEIKSVDCVLQVVVGMSYPERDRVEIPVSYSITRQADNQANIISADIDNRLFQGRGLNNVARHGTKRK